MVVRTKKIFENNEYAIYTYEAERRHKMSTTYRVHFFQDEKTNNVMKKKSFITKNSKKIKKYMEES